MQTGIALLIVFSLLALAIRVSLVPKCRDCKTKGVYNEAWDKFYCPNCHKRLD